MFSLGEISNFFFFLKRLVIVYKTFFKISRDIRYKIESIEPSESVRFFKV